MKSVIFIWLFFFIAVLFFSFNVDAANHTFRDGFEYLGVGLEDSGLTGSRTEEAVLTSVIEWLLSFVAILALTALIVGGIMYIVSFGNDAKVATAKNIIFYAIVGLIVVGLSFSILFAVKTVFLGNFIE